MLILNCAAMNEALIRSMKNYIKQCVLSAVPENSKSAVLFLFLEFCIYGNTKNSDIFKHFNITVVLNLLLEMYLLCHTEIF